MAKFYRSIVEICWALGMVSMVCGAILHFVPVLMTRFNTEARGTLIFAGVMFLGTIATRAVGRTGIEPGR